MASGDPTDLDGDSDSSIADSMDLYFDDLRSTYLSSMDINLRPLERFLESTKLDSIFAEAFKSRKSLISVAERADILNFFQNGGRYHSGNATRLWVVTLRL